MEIKGYKAFNPGLVCNGKQYAENTTFEEPEADLCKCGMHFCLDPMDVLEYYPLINNNGEFSEFAEVVAGGNTKTSGNKSCTTKLHVGAKLNFDGFVEACVDFLVEKTKPSEVASGHSTKIGSSGHSTKIGSSGDSAKIGSSGNYAQIGSSGNYAQIGSSGNYAQIGNSGNYDKIGSSGDSAKIGNSGDSAKIGNSGDYAQIGSSGNYAQIGSSGDYAQIGSSGYYAQIGSSGNYDKIGSSGDSAKIGSSGDYAKIGSSGNYAKIGSSGKHSVICCAGRGSQVKAQIGSWITLAEWGTQDQEYIPVCVKTAKVDGEKIKADTWYALKNGEFVEVE